MPDQAIAPLMLPFQKFDAVVNVKHQCGAALSPCLRYFDLISCVVNLQFSRHDASLRSIRCVGQILYCRARLERASSTHPSHRLSFLKSWKLITFKLFLLGCRIKVEYWQKNEISMLKNVGMHQYNRQRVHELCEFGELHVLKLELQELCKVFCLFWE